MRRHGLWRDELAFRAVEYFTASTETGGEWHTQMDVIFEPRFEGYAHLSGQITVGLVGDGKLARVLLMARDWAPWKRYPIITPDEAIDAIKRGEGREIAVGTRLSSPIRITSCEIVYEGFRWTRIVKDAIISPVYLIKGEAYIPEWKKQSMVQFMVPAVRREFLKRPVGFEDATGEWCGDRGAKN